MTTKPPWTKGWKWMLAITLVWVVHNKQHCHTRQATMYAKGQGIPRIVCAGCASDGAR
jgi:hypothetical protein